MFCPNCGAQNLDTATACAKCGFALKAASSAPKFKGTMLMMNAPQTKPAAPAAPVAPPIAAPSVVQSPAASAPPSAAAPAAAAGPRPKMKGTMIGVAPPSLGSNSPVGGAAPAPQAPASTVAFASPPQYESPPQHEPPPQAAQQQPPASAYGAPVSSVNPLGGTIVASTGSFGGGAFPPAPSPPVSGGGYDIGAPPPGFGSPPQQGYGSPPQQQGYGAPPAAYGGGQTDALGATSPIADAQQPAGTAAMQQVPPAQMYAQPPYQPMSEDMMAVPGTVGGPNPIVTVLLIVFTFGIYGIYLLIKGKKQQHPPQG